MMPQQPNYFTSPGPCPQISYGHPSLPQTGFPQQQQCLAVPVGVPAVVPGLVPRQELYPFPNGQQISETGYVQLPVSKISHSTVHDAPAHWNGQFHRQASSPRDMAMSASDNMHSNNVSIGIVVGKAQGHGHALQHGMHSNMHHLKGNSKRPHQAQIPFQDMPQQQQQKHPNCYLNGNAKQHHQPQMPFQEIPQQQQQYPNGYYSASGLPQNGFPPKFQGYSSMVPTAIGVPVMGTPTNLFQNHSSFQQSFPDTVLPREAVPQGNQTGSNGRLMPNNQKVDHPGKDEYNANADRNSKLVSSPTTDDNQICSPRGNHVPFKHMYNDSMPFERYDTNRNGNHEPKPYRRTEGKESGTDGYGTKHPYRGRDDHGANYTGRNSGFGQPYRSREFRGNNFNRGRGERFNSPRKPYQCEPCSPRQLRCDPCDRTFSNSGDMHAHMSSHVKCDEEGCTFEASGKIIKEHKAVTHGKTTASNSAIARRARALRSTEDTEEVARWREERKRNYPTNANITRKIEEKKKRESQGILVDEEFQIRRQRIREVIAKQKRLGFQAVEIPYYYLRERPPRPNNARTEKENKKQEISKAMENDIAGNTKLDGRDENDKVDDMSGLTAQPDACSQASQDAELPQSSKSGCSSAHNSNVPTGKQGHSRKRPDRDFQSNRKRRKREYDSDRVTVRREPTLLYKLLERDIQKESSYIQQCCRFIVNNSFLQLLPDANLNHLKWIESSERSEDNAVNPRVKEELENVMTDSGSDNSDAESKEEEEEEEEEEAEDGELRRSED